MTAPDDVVCAVCRRNPGPLCDRCRHRTAEQLADLPAYWTRLRVALVPGPGTGGERVTSSPGEAPMPSRLGALSLLGPGSDDARQTFVPAERVWTTLEAAADFYDPSPPVVTWHREIVRDAAGRVVMEPVDDQSGVLPFRAWLRAWAYEWRSTLGHGFAYRAIPRRDYEDDRPRDRRLVAAPLGMGPARPPAQRPSDPVADEWRTRWPAENGGWGPIADGHHGYLTAWLPEAGRRHRHIADFVVSLTALTGAARAALGDADDLEYLGRCPEEVGLVDGAPRICGASLWQDPYASVITCPRCHTETGQDHRIFLARRILDAWPIDAHRRYPRGLIDILRPLACSTCRASVAVQWLDATERADRERFWRPGALRCPNGCPVHV